MTKIPFYGRSQTGLKNSPKPNTVSAMPLVFMPVLILTAASSFYYFTLNKITLKLLKTQQLTH